ncbi:MAG: hypothetical protein V1816_05785 [Pseudomonadota bacterium]
MKRLIDQMLLWAILCIFCLGFSGPALADDASSVTSGAAVLARSSDYSVYSHALITVTESGGARSLIGQDLNPTADDTALASHGEYFYRLGRTGANYVSKYALQAPSSPLWQFSAASGGDPNPHDLVFASANRAFLLMYELTKAWIVNPSVGADEEDEFKTGELDLSAYVDGDGIPEMTSGLVVDGKLFVVMQRLDRNAYWDPANPAYVAVFDAASGEEIDTGKGGPGLGGGTLKGIRLDGIQDESGTSMNFRNPEVIQYLSETGLIYVLAAGPMFPAYSANGYTYGILSINPSTYETKVVVPAGTAASHAFNSIFAMAISSAEKGYFIDYTGYDNASSSGVCNLYSFNPTTGETSSDPIPGLSGRDFFEVNDVLRRNDERRDLLPYFNSKDLSGFRTGLAVDKHGLVWVGDASTNQAAIIDPDTDAVEQLISMNLKPIGFVFAETSSAIFISGASGGNDNQGCFIGGLFQP